MADVILLKGVSHTVMPLLAPREPAVVFDPMTGDAKLWIGTTVGNEMISGGTAGAPGTPGLGLTGLLSTGTPPVGVTAARADGVTDDTLALQGLIQWCQDHGGVPLNLAPGVHLISAPLRIANVVSSGPYTTVGGYQNGFALLGTASHGAGSGDPRGCTIRMGGVAQEAILLIGAQGVFHSRIENITFEAAPGTGTLAGIKTRDTNYSGLYVHNCQVTGYPDIGFYVTNPDGGLHGEFTNLHQFFCNGRVSMVKTNDTSGQSTPVFYTGLMGGIKNGGACLDIGAGAGNVTLNGFSVTAETGPLTNTLLRGAGFENVKISGGRLENIDCVYQGPGGGSASGHVKISDLAVWTTGAFHGPLVTGGSGSCQETITVDNCVIATGSNGVLTLDPGNVTLPAGGSANTIKFRDCTFGGWADVSILQTAAHVTLESCRASAADGFYRALVRP